MSPLLTWNAIRTLDLAGKEAADHRHAHIAPEHLLLALTRFESGMAVKALDELGISPQTTLSEVERHIEPGSSAPAGEIPLSPRTERVLRLSHHEATLLGKCHVGTEHLLLGILAEGESIAARILTMMGADLSATRRGVIRVLLREAHEA
ncbi:Clp protease N-terminal domain-containing protein [Thermostaphylospora chromogena]|uniref:Clp protease N-terminal domain-containing protein n=1 Tax=Thermostaphylospora chromogena TaxID=35622 RepID=UPI0013F67A83|nr:Clp protease N-terminal domain-containing protein [Thermostaphylospora chromogena]